jgi:hypothetical protein
MIGFASSRTGHVLPLEITIAGEVRSLTLPHRINVSKTDTYAALAPLGFGLMQVPRYRYAEDRGHPPRSIARSPAVAHAAFGALSKEPPAFAARSRLHRQVGQSYRAEALNIERPGLFLQS